MKYMIYILAIVLTAGCETIEVQTAKPFEGRYSSASDARKAIDDIQLDAGESIWILTNRTLKNLLKNANGK